MVHEINRLATRRVCASAIPRSSTGPTRRAASSKRRCARASRTGSSAARVLQPPRSRTSGLSALAGEPGRRWAGRIVNVPTRGIGDAALSRLRRLRGAGSRSGGRWRDRRRPALRRGRGACRDPRLLRCGRARAVAGGGGVWGTRGAGLDQETGYLGGVEAERTMEAQGRRALPRALGVTRWSSTRTRPGTRTRWSRSRASRDDRAAPRVRASGVPRGDLARHGHGRRGGGRLGSR